MAKKIIKLRGMIGLDDEATPKHLEGALKDANGSDVVLEINSPGGRVYAGLEMANMIRRYDGHITARVVGLAASMASYIPMMADKVEVEDNTIFMIHNPSTFAMGDQRDLQKVVDVLKGIARTLGKAYVARTGKSVEDIAALMDETTFLYGEEIKTEGFADDVVGDESDEDKAAALLTAQGEIQACIDLMKESGQAPQFDKIAALMGNEPPPVAKPKVEKVMNLDEFLAENPKAKAEHEKQLADVKAQTEEVSEALKAAAPILTGSYPESVKEHVTALAQAGDLAGVQAYIAMHDAKTEASNEAEAEKEQAGETPPDQPTNTASDGTIIEASQMAEGVARFKAQFGGAS